MKKIIWIVILLVSINFVVGAAPVINKTSIYSLTNQSNEDLIGICNATDDTEANLTYYYKWYINDVLNTSGSFSGPLETADVDDDDFAFAGSITSGSSNAMYVYDGNYDNGVIASLNQFAYFWFNYTKIRGASGSAFLVDGLDNVPYSTELCIDDPHSNQCSYIPIPDTCYDYYDNIVSMYVWIYRGPNIAEGNYSINCWNGGWYNLVEVYNVTNWPSNFDEEGMWWLYAGKGTNVEVNTLSASSIFKNDNVIFSCQTDDGTANSTWVNSSALTIISAAPNIDSVTLLPSSPTIDDNLSAYCEASDDDDVNTTYEYIWYLNDTIYDRGYYYYGIPEDLEQENATTESCTAPDCTNIFDGSYSTSVTAGPFTSYNSYENYTKPVAAVNATTTFKYTFGAISGTHSMGVYCMNNTGWQRFFLRNTDASKTWTDTEDIPDSCFFNNENQIELRYYWNSNHAAYTTTFYESRVNWDISNGVTEGSNRSISNISSIITNVGDEWIFSCRANDAVSNSDWTNSTTRTVISTFPTVDTVRIIPSIFATTDDITGECNATSPLNLSLAYSYKWFINDVLSGNTTSLTTTDYVKDDTVIFSCRVTDGINTTAWTNSSTSTVQNTAPVFTQIDFTYTISHGLNISLEINATDINPLDSIIFTINNTGFTINSSSGIINKTLGQSDVGVHDVLVTLNDTDDTINGFILFNITNTKPTIVDVAVLPAGGDPNINITCINETTDDDNDNIIDWSIKWYVDGIYNSSFNNQTLVESIYTINETEWTCSLAAADFEGFSDYVNSTPYKFGDNNAPVLFDDVLSASSGTNDNPFNIFVSLTEENIVSFVFVEITTPNLLSFNFSMSLDSGTQNNGTYKRTYIPGTDGTYTFRFYSRDGTSNIRQLDSILTYSESTYTAPAGGGGGGGIIIEADKEDCDIQLSVDTIKIAGTGTLSVEIFNAYTESYSPSLIFSDSIKFLQFTLPESTIASGRYGEINIIHSENDKTATGILTLTSSNCKDIEIPVEIGIGILSEAFFSKVLFNIGTFEFTNRVLGLIGLVFGSLIALSRKKLPLGTKFFITIMTAISLIVIFNFIF